VNGGDAACDAVPQPCVYVAPLDSRSVSVDEPRIECPHPAPCGWSVSARVQTSHRDSTWFHPWGLPARSAVTRATRALRLVTTAAIHGSVISWSKRYLRFIPTARTGDRIHLACFMKTTTVATTSTTWPVTRLPFADSAAGRTAAWNIRQAPARIEFLLASGEHKCLIAVATIQGLISQWYSSLSISGSLTHLFLYGAAYNRPSTLSNNAQYSVSEYITNRFQKCNLESDWGIRPNPPARSFTLASQLDR